MEPNKTNHLVEDMIESEMEFRAQFDPKNPNYHKGV